MLIVQAVTLNDPAGINTNEKLPCSSNTSTSPTNLEINNKLSVILSIYWKDQNCDLKPLATLQPNSSDSYNSFVGHNWIAVENKTSKVVSTFKNFNGTTNVWTVKDLFKVLTSTATKPDSTATDITANETSPTSTVANRPLSNGDHEADVPVYFFVIGGVLVILLAIPTGYYMLNRQRLVNVAKPRDTPMSPKKDELLDSNPPPTQLASHLVKTQPVDSLNSSSTSTSGDIRIVIDNILPPPVGMTSMVDESVLFDSRLVIRKKMAGSGGCGQVYKAKYANKDAVAKIPILEAHEQLIYDESQVMRKLSSPWTVN
ncbi:hypothetical protein HDV02_001022, partial [Globomyces sp. JEL0801]